MRPAGADFRRLPIMSSLEKILFVGAFIWIGNADRIGDGFMLKLSSVTDQMNALTNKIFSSDDIIAGNVESRCRPGAF